VSYQEQAPAGVYSELYAVQERLHALHGADGLSWRSIAQLDDYQGISPATLSAVARGRDPRRSPQVREKLGLPGSDAFVEVLSVSGGVAPGSSVLGPSRRCIRCGAPFVSNHPRRRRCFACSKPRG